MSGTMNCACKFEWRDPEDFSGKPPVQLELCGYHSVRETKHEQLEASHERLRASLERIKTDVDSYFGKSQAGGATYPKYFDISMHIARAALSAIPEAK